ncbi:hypothetical protein EDC96DRAFT_264370 [Choanephora cucurbitarum]|nr:hypothetical protein EDC96DRAFT_264370 [Choanephora cucurbitarum]
MLKTPSEVASLEPKSTDCFTHGLVNHYIHQPDRLKNLCLAQFASWYTFFTSSRRRTVIGSEDTYVDEEIADEVNQQEETIGNFTALKENEGYIRKRRKGKVIRFRRYNIHQDCENFFREMLLLYYTRRNEEQDIKDQNFEREYSNHLESIQNNFSEFNTFFF